MMGGSGAVRKAAAEAAKKGRAGELALEPQAHLTVAGIDPADAEARRVRADSARALGQRTTSANARGFYMTEALQIEGSLKVQGQPMTLDAIRTFVGTPGAEQLAAASVDENLQFVRYLVDPRKADGTAPVVHARHRGRSANPAASSCAMASS